MISIHAPREGGDLLLSAVCLDLLVISIHAPREGGDPINNHIIINSGGFQSTPPARGATNHLPRIRKTMENFNPRPPRGGRQQLSDDRHRQPFISIHAPREGGDFAILSVFVLILLFQSTPPARGATHQARKPCQLSNQFQSTPPARGAT